MAKNTERRGDTVADIANQLIYMVTGEWPDGGRVKKDETSRIFAAPEA